MRILSGGYKTNYLKENDMPLKIKLLKAQNGDCILIEYGSALENVIVIDGGQGRECQRQLRAYMDSCINKEKNLRLLMVTHNDEDHITGIQSLLNWKKFDSAFIKEMWFNYEENQQINDIQEKSDSTKISWKQANALEQIVKRENINTKNKVVSGNTFIDDNIMLTVLCPGEEQLKTYYENCGTEDKSSKIARYNDYNKTVEELNAIEFQGKVSLSNRTSIVVLLEYENDKMLFLGDAPADEVVTVLKELQYINEKPLEVLCCKISHHASRHNTSADLIKLLRCHNYFISTNLTASGRPSKECLSRIVCNSIPPTNFYCNYPIKANEIFTEDEISRYQIRFITMDENGLLQEELKDV